MFGERFVRRRPRLVASATNPDRLVASSTLVDEAWFVGFLDSESSSDVSSGSREQVQSQAVLYIEDIAFDVRRGDRVESEDGERRWKVVGFPPAPINPFTGWQPYRQVRLEEVVG